MGMRDIWKEIESLLDAGSNHLTNEEFQQALPLIVQAQGLVDTCLENTVNIKKELARVAKMATGCVAVQELIKAVE